MTGEDVTSLFREYRRTRDEQLRNEIRNRLWMEPQHQALVDEMASRYFAPLGQNFITKDDIYQEAQLALMDAIDRYDPDGLHRGRSFPTVARFAMRHRLRRELGLDLNISEQPTIPLAMLTPLEPPSWLIEDRYKTQEMMALGPSVEEQVIAAVDGAQVSATLEAALLLLSERQRWIIERRFGLGGDQQTWTLAECGRALGRHKSSVQRQQQKAINLLRAQLAQSDDGILELRSLFERRRARQKRAA